MKRFNISDISYSLDQSIYYWLYELGKIVREWRKGMQEASRALERYSLELNAFWGWLWRKLNTISFKRSNPPNYMTYQPDVKSKLWFESKMYYVSHKEWYNVKENSENQGLDNNQ